MRDVLPGVVFYKVTPTSHFPDHNITRATTPLKIRKITKNRLPNRVFETLVPLLGRICH